MHDHVTSLAAQAWSCCVVKELTSPMVHDCAQEIRVGSRQRTEIPAIVVLSVCFALSIYLRKYRAYVHRPAGCVSRKGVVDQDRYPENVFRTPLLSGSNTA